MGYGPITGHLFIRLGVFKHPQPLLVAPLGAIRIVVFIIIIIIVVVVVAAAAAAFAVAVAVVVVVVICINI